MPSGKHWTNFIFINLAFMFYIIGIYYLSSIQKIRANWSLYRCNPMYMPLSDNIDQDFIYCIQNIQTNFMGYLLQPLTNITGVIGGLMGGFIGELNGIRAMFDKIRTTFSFSLQGIFGVFMGLVVEFQKIIIGIKDLMGKTIGSMVSLLYVMDGSIKTMKSAWNGPPGQMIQKVGKCFHPETKIRLKSGSVVCMKDVKAGDILVNGSIVVATMQIDNSKSQDPFYKIKEESINGGFIYVTGSHMVHDNEVCKFVRVEEYKQAQLTDEKHNWFSCLITSDHKIQIGDTLFWDWEDYYCK
uniref:Hint domain-containing protein n=1 Tax=viral metagenome TaxID=1070528 RepID=A0A6C0E3U0_9ZZZZ